MALSAGQLLVVASGLALGLGYLYLNFWRALLFLRPSSLVVEAETPPDQCKVPEALARVANSLGELGFVGAGSHREKAPLARELIGFDYVHPGERCYATLFAGPGEVPKLYFLSRTDRGAFVLSADHRRPAREVPNVVFSGGLESCPPERLFRAHLRTVASFGSPIGRFDQPGRIEVAQAWLEGPGRADVRLQNVYALLWSGAVIVVLAALVRVVL